MKNAMDVKPDTEHLKFLVLGESGSGKSTFAATLPTPAFVLDCDKGILSYAGKDFDYESFELSPAGWKSLNATITTLMKDSSYKTVVLDSITTVSLMAMELSLQMNPQRSPTGGPIWNVHYGAAKTLVEGIIFKLLQYKGNICVIGHIKTVTDDDTGVTFKEPVFYGDTGSKIPNLFDEVYYSTVKNKGGKPEYRLQTANLGLYKGRSRLSGVAGKLPLYIPNDYGSLKELINKGE